MENPDRTGTRFVLLSQGRSGSSLVMSLLKSHPEIYCHGEVFHPNLDQRQRHIGRAWQDAHDIADFDRRPLKLAYSVLNDTPVPDGETCVGFKLFRQQQPKVAATLAGDTDVKKIVLERPNKLAGFSSVALARQTGIWNLPAGQTRAVPEQPPLPFDRAHFLRFVERETELFRAYRDASEGDVTYLRYDTLNRAAMAAVLDVLGVPQAELLPGKTKLNGNDILGRFAPNAQGAVLKTLDEIGQPGWVHEQIEPWTA